MEEETNLLSENLERIKDATDEIRTTLNMPDATIEELGDAVVAPPSGTINITTNGSINVAEYESATVDVVPVEKVAYFCDYDGTILYSYGVDEIAALEELPANPSHPGLIAQGWNWTLPQIKECVADGGHIDIGQTYITDDNSTRIHITLSDVNLLSPTLTLALNGTANIN